MRGKAIGRGQTRRGKRVLEKRAPRVVENEKQTVIVKGGKTSEVVSECLRSLYLIKKPLALHLRRRNPLHPFEDDTKLEHFSTKFDASLFLFGANSKKHPDSLIFGRMFDGHVLDMVELRIEQIRILNQLGPRAMLGTKPSLIFQGEAFENDDQMKRVGNLLGDWFRGPLVENVRLQGLELVIALTAIQNDMILLRTYRSMLKKSSDGNNPRVELIEVGPSIDFSLQRRKLGEESLFKSATRQPQQLKAKMRKNTSQDVFGTTGARIHVGRQNLDSMQTRKMKALR